jgi:hypothetical protein
MRFPAIRIQCGTYQNARLTLPDLRPDIGSTASEMAKPILGTMRLLEHHADADTWAGFFATLWDAGVCTMHSSHEYESFELVCTSIATLKRSRPDIAFRHVVKLADPHFSEDEFDAHRFVERLTDYRERLGTHKIHEVQWMWRAGLDDDRARTERFVDAASTIHAIVKDCKDQGFLERFLCFPYTPAFAAAAIEQPAIDGLVVYRNRDELDYEAALDRAHSLGKHSLIIRPFNGGAVLNASSTDPVADYRFAVDHPAITGAIVSMSKARHAEALVATSRQ